MTTQTSTSNSVTGLSPETAGLPDEATLSRIASALFQALPGEKPNFDLPASPPQPADPFLALGGRAPALATGRALNPEIPHNVPNLPDSPEKKTASLPGVGGANYPQVPYSPVTPEIATLTPTLPVLAGSPSPSVAGNDSPFYFLQGSGASHAPQPVDPALALGGRAPAVATSQGLNPAIPHSVPTDLDAPEQKTESLPVVGGASLPSAPAKVPAPVATSDVTSLTPSVPSVPANVASAAPSSAFGRAPDTSAASSPFYFVNEGGAPVPTSPTAPATDIPDEALFAQSFGLPGADALKALLAGSTSNRAAPSAAPTPSPSGFYFLDVPSAGSAWQDKPTNIVPVSSAHQPFDVQSVRRDFPILQERVNGRPLVWFDNAATTHKPKSVIERVSYFYEHENSNIHRAAHELAARATDAYEHARKTIARFLGAKSESEIIFVRGTTEAINLVAKTWGVQNIGAGDEIIVSNLEHHANIVPWFQLAKQVGAKLRVIPVDDSGQIRLDEYRKLLNDRTKIVSITQVSNALGTVTPVAEVIALAHQVGAKVLVDGAQSVAHLRVDVQALDADFFVFSGHKIFGPTGIGVVYGKADLLEKMPPWQGGGNMIQDVTFEQIIFQPAPNKFEAGTGNIADAVGLGAAIEYVESLGLDNIARYEHDLLEYGQHGLSSVSGLRLIGTAREKASVMSFTLEGYENEEVGKALNKEGIAVRTGHHCAQPILRRFGVETTVRPSLAFYNTTEEIDLLVSILHQLRRARSIRR
ncbi:family 2A encapsulin nanocompartment cargo protein cysteine desulfurase [Aquirhabdus parva]|uniref:cysteine desulfurase n=1 Tax=Aquirhabdus parva TaxID=2283318 RepID=A0A345P3S2_9GAMM|nr:family 2A encapsulin nanocompartment cargo protein cysteine desulfurase [Aquirhabdus parva]AXI01931.1 SufS family cysteine desulfurase [Aquirhabdus parva]